MRVRNKNASTIGRGRPAHSPRGTPNPAIMSQAIPLLPSMLPVLLFICVVYAERNKKSSEQPNIQSRRTDSFKLTHSQHATKNSFVFQ